MTERTSIYRQIIIHVQNFDMERRRGRGPFIRLGNRGDPKIMLRKEYSQWARILSEKNLPIEIFSKRPAKAFNFLKKNTPKEFF